MCGRACVCYGRCVSVVRCLYLGVVFVSVDIFPFVFVGGCVHVCVACVCICMG